MGSKLYKEYNSQVPDCKQTVLTKRTLASRILGGIPAVIGWILKVQEWQFDRKPREAWGTAARYPAGVML